MSAALSLDAVPSLVDLLLAEQQKLRAVDEFSAFHDEGGAHGGHLQGGRFETLIPSTAPGAGQQYAFAVDLDACTGCKACVTACHSLNGLEPGETWRKVGEIEGVGVAGASAGSALRQTVTTACHHCEDPACAAGCPVQAYQKDPTTGIVIHLDDQCIGCHYCQLTCPYDVPQFSERLGVVRKCDMCHGRLAAGEAPACVQGCPNGAISIELVEVGQSAESLSRRNASEAMLLPVVAGGMPLSALTRPTTRYRSARSLLTDFQPVEASAPSPAVGHTPLAILLVLTQASIGTLLFDGILAASLPESAYGARARLVSILAAAVLGLGGLAASVLHLGRPQWAFRAFLGLRTSWMSREIVVFGGFATALVAALGASVAAELDPTELPPRAVSIVSFVAGIEPWLRAGALLAGLIGLYCSIQIYAVTGRPLWRRDRTALRFGCTALLLGAAVAMLAWNAGDFEQGSRLPAAAARIALATSGLVLAVFALKLVFERTRWVRGTPGFDEAALARTRALLAGPLVSSVRMRIRLGAFGVLVLVLAASARALIPETDAVLGLSILQALGSIGVAGCIAGEIAERRLFFTSEAMRGMPRSSPGRPA